MNLQDLNLSEWLLIGIFAGVLAILALLSVIAMRPSGSSEEGGVHPILERLANEPALLSGFVAAAAALTATFGFELSTEQTGAIMAFLVAGLALFVRQQVTPVRKLSATTRRRLTK